MAHSAVVKGKQWAGLGWQRFNFQVPLTAPLISWQCSVPMGHSSLENAHFQTWLPQCPSLMVKADQSTWLRSNCHFLTFCFPEGDVVNLLLCITKCFFILLARLLSNFIFLWCGRAERNLLGL